jgi:hypothetical protein
MAFTAARMSALARFSLQAPALLACAKERAEGHGHTIDGRPRVPCDTYLRARREPRAPQWLRPVGTSLWRPLQRGKALAPLPFREAHALWALEAPEEVSSQAMHGASCLPPVHRQGALTSGHPRVGAARMQPDLRAGLPWRPAPSVRHDGTAPNEGERHAAQRLVPQRR